MSAVVTTQDAGSGEAGEADAADEGVTDRAEE